MGGIGSGRSPDKEMERKVEVLRRITGNKPFSTRTLPNDIVSQLGYGSKEGFMCFLANLANGRSVCGRKLDRIGLGEYAWVGSSQGGAESVVQSVLPHDVVRDLTPDEAAALDMIQELLIRSQDGPIGLTPKMVAMNDEEFLEFMEKMATVKAALNRGQGHNAVGVWSLVRDKFSEFYQTAQAVRSGQLELPPEPPPPLEAEPSEAEERLDSLCCAMARELSVSKGMVKNLEEELAEAKAKCCEDERRYKLFRSELDKLRRSAKPPIR